MTELSHWQIYITWIITALAGAFGIGVGYAVLKTDLSGFKSEFRIYKETISASAAAAASMAAQQITHIEDRIERVESRIEEQVGYNRCKDMREDCNRRVVTQLSELGKAIQTNREVVIAQMRETEKFIGRVEEFMKKNGMKNHD
jgi:hypothetical protein